MIYKITKNSRFFTLPHKIKKPDALLRPSAGHPVPSHLKITSCQLPAIHRSILISNTKVNTQATPQTQLRIDHIMVFRFSLIFANIMIQLLVKFPVAGFT